MRSCVACLAAALIVEICCIVEYFVRQWVVSRYETPPPGTEFTLWIPLMYLVGLYVTCCLIRAYYACALVSYVLSRLRGEDASVQAGLRVARSLRSNVFAATFALNDFVVPFMVDEGLGFWAAYRESIKLLRGTISEVMGSDFSREIRSHGRKIIGIIVSGSCIVIGVGHAFYEGRITVVSVILAGIAVIVWIATLDYVSSLNWIMRTVVYHYGRENELTRNFDEPIRW